MKEKTVKEIRRYADELIDRQQSEANQVSEAIICALDAADGEPDIERRALVLASLEMLRDNADDAINAIEGKKANRESARQHLINAGRLVIHNWERGDLAEAVNALRLALDAQP